MPVLHIFFCLDLVILKLKKKVIFNLCKPPKKNREGKKTNSQWRHLVEIPQKHLLLAFLPRALAVLIWM